MVVAGIVDTVICYTILGKVVRPYLLRASAGAHLKLSAGSGGRELFIQFDLVETGSQVGHGDLAILNLRPLGLALHHYP